MAALHLTTHAQATDLDALVLHVPHDAPPGAAGAAGAPSAAAAGVQAASAVASGLAEPSPGPLAALAEAAGHASGAALVALQAPALLRACRPELWPHPALSCAVLGRIITCLPVDDAGGNDGSLGLAVRAVRCTLPALRGSVRSRVLLARCLHHHLQLRLQHQQQQQPRSGSQDAAGRAELAAVLASLINTAAAAPQHHTQQHPQQQQQQEPQGDQQHLAVHLALRCACLAVEAGLLGASEAGLVTPPAHAEGPAAPSVVEAMCECVGRALAPWQQRQACCAALGRLLGLLLPASTAQEWAGSAAGVASALEPAAQALLACLPTPSASNPQGTAAQPGDDEVACAAAQALAQLGALLRRVCGAAADGAAKEEVRRACERLAGRVQQQARPHAIRLLRPC